MFKLHWGLFLRRIQQDLIWGTKHDSIELVQNNNWNSISIPLGFFVTPLHVKIRVHSVSVWDTAGTMLQVRGHRRSPADQIHHQLKMDYQRTSSMFMQKSGEHAWNSLFLMNYISKDFSFFFFFQHLHTKVSVKPCKAWHIK